MKIDELHNKVINEISLANVLLAIFNGLSNGVVLLQSLISKGTMVGAVKSGKLKASEASVGYYAAAKAKARSHINDIEDESDDDKNDIVNNVDIVLKKLDESQSKLFDHLEDIEKDNPDMASDILEKLDEKFNDADKIDNKIQSSIAKLNAIESAIVDCLNAKNNLK